MSAVTYFSTVHFYICIFLWNGYCETNELRIVCSKNMFRKDPKNKIRIHPLFKKSELFVWINSKFVCEDKRDGAFSTPPVSFHSALLSHPPLSLFHIQPIIGAPDGSLMCSQRAPLHAHVSAVEWVTWTDSRWCSLGTRGLIHPLSPLSLQSIIILLLCLLPQDHWGDSGPPSSVPSFTFVQGNVSLLSLGLFIQGAGGS